MSHPQRLTDLPERPGVPRVLDDAPVALLVTDMDGAVTAGNRAWHALAALDDAWSAGDGWPAMTSDGDRDRLQAALRTTAVNAVETTVDVELVTGTGRRSTRWNLSPRTDEAGVVIAVMDLTDERAIRAELEQRATHDPLTGLFNRSELLAFLAHALRRLDRHPGRVAVLFVDLDGFKAVNDDNGHLVGDQVLTAAARRLRDAVRPQDVVARTGGDEFAVLCEDIGDLDPEQITSRVRSAFTTPLEAGGISWTIGASVGAAATDQPDTPPEALLDAADRAMYDAKAAHPADRVGAGAVPARPTPQPGLSADLADRPIRDLFAVAFALTSCASTVDEPAASQLTSALDDLDRIIGDVRLAVFRSHVRPAESPGRPEQGPPGDIDELVKQMRRTARHLDGLATSGRADGSDTLDLLEATYSAHGAVRALEQARRVVHAGRPRDPRAAMHDDHAAASIRSRVAEPTVASRTTLDTTTSASPR